MKTPLRLVALLLSLAALQAGTAADSVSERSALPATAKMKVDLNTATAAELEKLPGIGTDFANAVIAARPFHSVDELARVPGIGAEKLKTLRDKITASPVTAPATKPDSSSTSKISPPSPTNSGKAIDNKPVTERYDSATDARESAKDSGSSNRDVISPAPVIASPSAREASSDTMAATIPVIDPNASTNVPIIGGEKTINVNTATKAELEALPEIAPATAQAIIDARPFISREDVLRVKEVSEGTFEAIKEKITVK